MNAKVVAGIYLIMLFAFFVFKMVEVSGLMPVLFVLGMIAVIISVMVAFLVLAEPDYPNRG